jgi:hypothetical protein
MSTTDITQPDPLAPVATPRPWYRRSLTWAITAAVVILGAGGIALGLTLTQGSGNGAAGVVTGDGYTVTQTVTADQLRAHIGSDYAMIVGGDGAAGVKGTQEEAVMPLSAAGKALIQAIPGSLQQIGAGAGSGITATMRGDYLILTGDASAFETP